MLVSPLALRAGLAVALAAGASLATAQSASFAVGKSADYLQTADDGADFLGYSAILRIDASIDFPYAAATVNSPSVFTPQDLISVADRTLLGYSPIYPDLASLDADYPPGEYEFVTTAGSLPATSIVITVPPSLFCPEVPYLTGTTYSNLRAIDPSSDFVGTVNGFSPDPAANSTVMQLFVVDLSGAGPVYLETFAPENTEFTIPANTILPNRAYFMVIYYFNNVLDFGAGPGGADNAVAFLRDTTVYFNTRRPCQADLNFDGLVDDIDFVLFAQAYDLFYCGMPDMPADCQADLTNDGLVADDDFVLFAQAYDLFVCPD